MKSFLPLVILAILCSCGSQKETIQEVEATAEDVNESAEETVQETSENYRVVGMVHEANGNCPLYIETQLKDEVVNVKPNNLDERFHHEGMRLKFAFSDANYQVAFRCPIEFTATLSDVTLMR